MINVAVIGTGYIGPLHIEALCRLSGVRVKGVCDANPEIAHRIAVKYDVEKVYTDWREVIDDTSIRVVHICSPNRLHYPMNMAAIEAGKHILSEKPLAMALEEAEELAELSEKEGIVTGIHFCYRYYPLVLEMALRMRRGEAGDVLMVTGTWFQDWLSLPGDWSWRLDRQEAGESNIAADLGSHWFDLVQFITGLRVTEVMADFSTLVPVRQRPARQGLSFEKVVDMQYQDVKVDLEEYAAILFRLSNGAPGSFTTCQAANGRKSDAEIQVYGSKYSMAWDHRQSNKLWIGYRDRPNETLIESPVLQNPAVSSYASLPTGHPLGYHDAVLNLFKDFYEAVRADGKEPERALPRPTFRTGMEEMKNLKAIVHSAKNRIWVRI